MTPARIARAAEVLRGEATCLRESYGVGPDYEWPDEDIDDATHEAMQSYTEMLELARELDALAKCDPLKTLEDARTLIAETADRIQPPTPGHRMLVRIDAAIAHARCGSS